MTGVYVSSRVLASTALGAKRVFAGGRSQYPVSLPGSVRECTAGYLCALASSVLLDASAISKPEYGRVCGARLVRCLRLSITNSPE